MGYKGESYMDSGHYGVCPPRVHNPFLFHYPTVAVANGYYYGVLADTGYYYVPTPKQEKDLEENDDTGSQREPSGDTGTERDDHRPVRSVGDARDVL